MSVEVVLSSDKVIIVPIPSLTKAHQLIQNYNSDPNKSDHLTGSILIFYLTAKDVLLRHPKIPINDLGVAARKAFGEALDDYRDAFEHLACQLNL
jgi:hypothetical protein